MTGSRAEREPLLASVARLRATLEDVAHALENMHVDELLVSAARLDDALARVRPALVRVEDMPHEPVRRELTQATAMLLRCERLGSSLDDIVRMSAAARGPIGYGKDGAHYASSPVHALNTRV